MKTFLTTFTLCFLLSINFYAQTYIQGGDISGEWNAIDSPFIIQGDLTVNEGNSLIINEGTEVLFEGYFGLTIEGDLILNGTETHPIILSPKDTTGINKVNNTGRWKGIFINSNDNATNISLNHMHVKYTCSYKTSSYQTTGALSLYNVKQGTIKNCLIHNHIKDTTDNHINDNIGAINIRSSSKINIENNRIEYNHRTPGIFAYLSDNIDIINNEIAHNYYHQDGCGINMWNTERVLIEANYIHHNRANNQGGGIRIGPFTKNIQIINNDITYNTVRRAGAGLYVNNSSENIITGNLVANNACTATENCGITDGGGGANIRHCDHQLIQNNIFVNNSATINAAGVILYKYRNEGENLIFSNNIVANNSSLSYTGGGGLTIYGTSYHFYNNVITNNHNRWGDLRNIDFFQQYDYTVWRNNLSDNLESITWRPFLEEAMDSAIFIFSNPLFINPTLGVGVNYDGSTSNWNVQDSSLAINNGFLKADTLPLLDTDFDGNRRIVNTIDIGAYELQEIDFTNINEKSKDENLVSIYPNPAIDKITINLTNKPSYNTTFTITNVNGAVLKTIPIALVENKNQLEVDLTSLAPGVYIVELRDNSKIIINQSLIKVDNP